MRRAATAAWQDLRATLAVQQRRILMVGLWEHDAHLGED
jgi:hypothetical protein